MIVIDRFRNREYTSNNKVEICVYICHIIHKKKVIRRMTAETAAAQA